LLFKAVTGNCLEKVKQGFLLYTFITGAGEGGRRGITWTFGGRVVWGGDRSSLSRDSRMN
jgi:hypothetical protein